MIKRWRWVGATALLLVVAACTGTGGSGSGGGSGASTAESAAGGKAAGVSANGQPALGRSLIKSADMEVEATNVASAVDRAESIATGSGGQVVSLDRSNLSLPGARADLTLRVPAEQFDSTVASLARLAAPGTNVQWHKDIQDVTDTVVDVNARVSAQRHALTRLQGLLDSAKNLDQVIRLEDELTQREADLESLEARQRALQEATAMSTVSVHLSAAPVTRKASGPAGFVGGLLAGWHAFAVAAAGAVTALGAMLPFLGVAAGLLFAGLWVRRRLRAVKS